MKYDYAVIYNGEYYPAGTELADQPEDTKNEEKDTKKKP